METGANSTIIARTSSTDPASHPTGRKCYTVPAGKILYITYAIGYPLGMAGTCGMLYVKDGALNEIDGADKLVIAKIYQGYIAGQCLSEGSSSTTFTMPIKCVAGKEIWAKSFAGDCYSCFVGWLQNV